MQKPAREIQQTYKEVLSNMDIYRIRHRMTDHSFFRPSFTARLIKEAIGETERATDGFISTAFKIPKILSDYRRIIPLATLLDSHSRGRDLGAVNESGMDDDGLRRRKGKKRRGLRL
jgi:hypothetical protein